MKKTPATNKANRPDDLRSEYEFDYAKAKPNRFASNIVSGGRMVILDPDVANVFRNSKDVNKALKGLLNSIPKKVAKPAKNARKSA